MSALRKKSLKTQYRYKFFTRKNGFSKGIYGSLNCGLGSRDKKEYVIKNLRKVAKNFNLDISDLKLMEQTHSSKVIIINKKNRNKKKFGCDALITNLRNTILGVLTADCVPIIFFEKKQNLIGCAHSGWKGAYNRIIENVIKRIKRKVVKPKITAVVGPCIGKNSYEVGVEFKNKFEKRYKGIFFKKNNNNRYYFDLRKFVNYKLKKNGVRFIKNLEIDTFTNEKNFFSYRRSVKRSEIDYGRCISVVLLKRN